MKGVVKYQRGDGFTELRDVDVRKPNANEVLIEVHSAGICGSDLHIHHDHINLPMRPPVVIGHEFSGTIIECGSEISSVMVGDRVTVEPTFSICGRCDYCRSGFYNLCNHREIIGYWHNGAFAKYCTTPEHGLHKLPDNVDLTSGSLTEPVACCVHGVIEQTKVSAGDFVAITGPGTIGLLSLQMAKAEGGIVAVCGTSVDANRLKRAAELGADLTIDVEKEDAVEIIKARTGGYGADVVLECSGAAPAAPLGIELTRKRGKYTQMGLFGNPINIDFEQIAFKELQVTGFISQKKTAWERALKLMEHGMVSTKALITHEMHISEWQEAFDLFEKREGVKLMLRPE